MARWSDYRARFVVHVDRSLPGRCGLSGTFHFVCEIGTGRNDAIGVGWPSGDIVFGFGS